MNNKISLLSEWASKAKQFSPELRLGQCYFNEALKILPLEKLSTLTGTPADCFYNDDRIPLFLKEVERLLNEKSPT